MMRLPALVAFRQSPLPLPRCSTRLLFPQKSTGGARHTKYFLFTYLTLRICPDASSVVRSLMLLETSVLLPSLKTTALNHVKHGQRCHCRVEDLRRQPDAAFVCPRVDYILLCRQSYWDLDDYRIVASPDLQQRTVQLVPSPGCVCGYGRGCNMVCMNQL